MSYAKSITRAKGGDWNGQQGLVPTPGHSAKDRGLSIRDTEDGRDVVLYAHNEADFDWRAYKDGLRDEGLLPSFEPSPPSQIERPATTPATYTYRDADGRPVFRVLRRPGKEFPCQHPDGNGGWSYGMGGADPVPYRLPELIAASQDAPVYICEGEKDADNLAKLGFVATTNPGGAGKWRDTFAVYLTRRECVILEDNDDAGRAHAADVSRKLAGGGVDHVTLRLPGLPEKGDVSDWLAAGGSAAELIELTAAAYAAPKPALDTGLPVIDPRQWEGVEPPERVALIKDWLMRGTAALFTGTGGVGKSLAGQQMTTALGTGTRFLGLETVQTPALYITCEDSRDELHRRQVAINPAQGVRWSELHDVRLVSLLGEPDNQLMIFGADGIGRPGPLFHKIRALALDMRAGFIALDHVAHLFAGHENDRQQVTGFLNLLNGLALELDATVMILGHENKLGAAYSGSTAWVGGVRQHLHLAYPDDADDAAQADPDARILSRPKANYARRGDPLQFVWHRGAFIVPDGSEARHEGPVTAGRDNQIFLDCLAAYTATNRATSHNKHGGNYAPKLFARMSEARRLKMPALEAAMDRLFALGKIKAGQRLWRDAKSNWVTGIAVAGISPTSRFPAVPDGYGQVVDNTTPTVPPPVGYITTLYSGAATEVPAPDPEKVDGLAAADADTRVAAMLAPHPAQSALTGTGAALAADAPEPTRSRTVF